MTSGGNDKTENTTPRGLARELGKRGPFQSDAQELYLNLLRTSERLSEQFDALFKAHGLSQTQYNALRILRGHAVPISSGTVGRELLNREPDITRLLDRLVKMKFVVRERCERDRRIMLASLTPSGYELLAELDDPVSALQAKQLKHMTRDEMRTMIDLLERAREGAATDLD